MKLKFFKNLWMAETMDTSLSITTDYQTGFGNEFGVMGVRGVGDICFRVCQ